MTEQLFKLERRLPMPGETVAYSLAGSVAQKSLGVLVPVPNHSDELRKLCAMCGYPDNGRHELDAATLIGEWIDKHKNPIPTPHTFAWAMGEMYANPMKEYIRSESSIRWRYNHDSRALEMFIFGGWTMHVIIYDLDLELPWSPCEAEESKPVPQPGSYSEAYAAVLAGKVAIGSNGWRYWGYRESDKACSAARLDGGDVRVINWPHPRSGDWLPGGWTIEAPKPAIVPGTREWLASLPDGTWVEHDTYGVFIKRGDRLYGLAGGVETSLYIPINNVVSPGWRLRTQPQAEPTPYPTQSESRLDSIEDRITALELDTLEQRVERLEKLMEVQP